jgi:surface polysaccharide O-acyltransferase-like enzyme
MQFNNCYAPEKNAKLGKISFIESVNIVLRKSFNFLGWTGALFIIYGTYNHLTGRLNELKEFADLSSAFLTLVGVVMTALSIYLPQNPSPPEHFSKVYSAPVTIICAVIALVYLLMSGSLSTHIVNGFALLAIAGGLFRIQGNPRKR